MGGSKTKCNKVQNERDPDKCVNQPQVLSTELINLYMKAESITEHHTQNWVHRQAG